MGAGSGVAVATGEKVSIMVNEEDHLRIQALVPGFDLNGAWRLADGLDTALGRRRAFAYDPRLGYLTACPSNAGTGMRASVMLHIPALTLSAQVEPVMRGAAELAFTVRGMLGEGSGAVGNFFQISNQSTLGESERGILRRLRAAVLRIAHAEEAAREKLLDGRRLWLYDQVGQAYARLRFAYLLTSKEALDALSLVLLGSELGLFPKLKRPPLLRLMTTVQAGHLQRRAKTVLDEPGRDACRAALVRAFFSSAEDT
jgi:protein arginine kinase